MTQHDLDTIIQAFDFVWLCLMTIALILFVLKLTIRESVVMSFVFPFVLAAALQFFAMGNFLYIGWIPRDILELVFELDPISKEAEGNI